MSENKTQFQTKPVVSGKIARLPAGKVASFKFPPVVNPERQAMYASRKVSVINNRDFRRLFSGFRKEDLFIGSLKLL